MKYSEFVKEKMAELKAKGSIMSASEKMSYIGQQWRKSNGDGSKEMATAKPKKVAKSKESNEILEMFSVKDTEPKKKSKQAVKKLVAAVKKMMPIDEDDEDEKQSKTSMGTLGKIKEVIESHTAPKQEARSFSSRHIGF